MKPDKVDEWRTALARFNHEIIDVEQVVEDQVKLCRRLQETLRNEILVDGSRQFLATEGMVKKLKELSHAVTAMVQAHTTLQKTAKARAAAMGPEELQNALLRAIMALPTDTRRDFIYGLVEAHNTRTRAAVEDGLEDPLDHRKSRAIIPL